MRADTLWHKYRDGTEGAKYKCDHNDCKKYNKWKLRHPKQHQALIKEADNTVFAVYENLQTVLTTENSSFKVSGTIRSQIPPCLGLAAKAGNHPFTCKNCFSHKNYLKMKLEKKKTAAYSTDENRFGKKGMCHKYLTEEELRSVTTSLVKEKKEMKKALQKVNLIRSTSSWTSRLLDASDRDEEEKFINDLSLALQTDKLNVNSVQFQLMSNLVNKLLKNRNHKYSDIVINVGRLLCNQVGSTGYQTWEVSCFFCLIILSIGTMCMISFFFSYMKGTAK